MVRKSGPENRLADKWWVLITIALGTFLNVTDFVVVNLTIPRLQSVFRANLHTVQWVMTVYMLTQAIIISTVPYLNRKLGTKQVYVGSLIIFLGGSLLCGLAGSLRMLIFFRFMQASLARFTPIQ